ncbi:ABC transporter permease [Nonomuraea angiospora]|uniref:Peptide/nickel transport system permease protein n=2 Tax=Nonomuraea TaxID=83681 RepID=A0A7W9LCN1_9ACTN|nr:MULTISPECIES: ABC transporter permease [Nonomuraea]MBB5778947.1 peptide/nickel transport system permease protein [Nonomuraea jabiensis]MBE1591807.1 peptide/nickel transport system permease protein [Nonomuraea angiospora]MDX3107337.1 ABC transporter permease [Nonomuraea angiospora]
MLGYFGRRLVYVVVTLWAISIVTFVIINLPPGDYVSTLVANAQAGGEGLTPAEIANLRHRYGLDDPLLVQYWRWITAILLHGDFGQSFAWNQAVSTLIGERVALSAVLSISSLLMVWAIAFPIGIYSAVKQYSWGDYGFSFLGFIGMAVPEFMLALILMYVGFRFFGQSVGGLFSPEFQDAAWNLGKVLDLLGHLWVPIVVIGVSGTAGMIRVTRANLLDELYRPYVHTARAKGLPEWKLLLKYPVRMSLSPFFSTVGWLLPGLIGGETIVSVVMSLPTGGPLLLNGVMNQDMYLVGSFIMILSTLTVIGTVVSDLALAWWDPRIRKRYKRE